MATSLTAPFGKGADMVVGWLVLTSQRDGSWKDDWDGEVHTDYEAALNALADAQRTLQHDHARLVRLVPVHPDEWEG